MRRFRSPLLAAVAAIALVAAAGLTTTDVAFADEAPQFLGEPYISGTGVVNSQHRCVDPPVTGSPQPSFSYEWTTSFSGVVVGRGEYYTPTAAQIGATLQCVIYASNSAGDASRSTSVNIHGNTVQLVGYRAAFTGDGAVLGSKSIGSTLTCQAPAVDWAPVGVLTYQWYRGGASINGANASTYVTGNADALKDMTCTAVAANSYGVTYGAVNSGADGQQFKMNGIAPTLPSSAYATGSPIVGDTVSCPTVAATGVPTPTVTYAWARIAGASVVVLSTTGSYQIQASDVGQQLYCVISATNGQSPNAQLVVQDFAPGQPVIGNAGTAPTIAADAAITGTARVGNELTCEPGTVTGKPTPTLTYVWKRGSTVLAGNGNKYTPVAADYGNSITCEITATNGVTPSATRSISSSSVAGFAPTVSAAGMSITGTMKVGSTITCAPPTTVTGVPTPARTYTWKRGGTTLQSGASQTYLLQTGDYDANITCVFTADNGINPTATRSITNETRVAGSAPSFTGSASINGTLQVGSELTCVTPTVGGAPTPSISYSWKRDVKPVGTNSSKYTPVEDDIGYKLTCELTASNAAGANATASATTGSKIAGIAPSLNGVAAISGTPRVGSQLVCHGVNATGTPTPSVAYTWKRGATIVRTASAVNTYSPTANDLGSLLTCEITATSSVGPAATASALTSTEVSGSSPQLANNGSLSGTARVGQELTCSAPTATGTPTPTVSVAWYRGSQLVSTASKYTVAEADYGAQLRCEATASNGPGSTDSKVVGVTVAVSGIAPSFGSKSGKISGEPRVGVELSCDAPTPSGTPKPNLSYSWKREGTTVGSARTYTPVAGDAEKQLTCQAIATNDVDSAVLQITESERGGLVFVAALPVTGSGKADNSKVQQLQALTIKLLNSKPRRKGKRVRATVEVSAAATLSAKLSFKVGRKKLSLVAKAAATKAGNVTLNFSGSRKAAKQLKKLKRAKGTLAISAPASTTAKAASASFKVTVSR